MSHTKRTGAMQSSPGKFEPSEALRDAMPRAPSNSPNQVIREPPVVFTRPLTYSINFSNNDYLEKAKADAIERAKLDADNAFARGVVPDYNVLVNSMPTDDHQVAVQMNFRSKMSHARQEEHQAPIGLPRGIHCDSRRNVWIDGRGRAVAADHGAVHGQYHAMSSTMPILNPSLQDEFMKYRAAQLVQDQMRTSTPHHEPPFNKVINEKYTQEILAKDSLASQPFHVQMHEKLYKNSGKRVPVHGRAPAYSGKRGGLELLCLAGDLTRANP